MPDGILKFTTNEPAFSDFIRRYSEAAVITFEAAFEAQGRELCARMMKFTPPLSGKSIKRSLWSRDIGHLAGYKAGLLSKNAGDIRAAFEKFSPFRDPDIESMSARLIGERRVEKDIRRVVKGVRNNAPPPAKENATVIVSQTNPRSANHDVVVDWGVRQKCQGRDAIRIYADRSGNVYGVDTANFMPNPSASQLAAVHKDHRGKRGRVTTAGSKDLVVGRWRWLNITAAPAQIVDAYIAKRQLMVGQGKGGWVAGFKGLGGKISDRGWVGRHIASGSLRGWPTNGRGVVNISIANNSAWASNGDPDRIIENAMESRERDMEKLIEKILEARWGEGAAGYNQQTKIW